jgi:hypothetical protein
VRSRIVLPSLESLPHTTCRVCGGSKINGLFTPLELKNTNNGPRCRKCIGEVSESKRKANRSGWGLTPPGASAE